MSKQRGRGKAYWSAVRLVTGQIFDELRIVGDDGETYYVTTTLRSYNAALDRWELVGMNEGGGLQDMGTGQHVRPEVHIEQKFGAAAQHPSTLGMRYYDMKPDRFSWTADRSADGGKTWSKDDQHIEARRIGPARSLGPLADGKKLRDKL